MKVLDQIKANIQIISATCVISLGIGGIIGYQINNDNVNDLEYENMNMSKKLREADVWFDLDIVQRERIKTLHKNGELNIPYGDETTQETYSPTYKEVELTPGNYVIGDDIAAGKYDVLAINGRGNIIAEGCINEILHTDGERKPNQFSNVILERGVTLKLLNGLSVRLIPVK